MRCHPAFFIIVRRRVVSEYVYEELTAGLQCTRYLGHEKFVVLHVLEKL